MLTSFAWKQVVTSDYIYSGVLI